MRRLLFILVLIAAVVMAAFWATDSRQRRLPLAAHPLQHATLLRHELTPEGFSLWTLTNPWDSLTTLHRYLLVPRESSVDTKTLEAYADAATAIVRTPVERAGVATSVHCGLMADLGVADAIVGVCEKQYIDLPQVREGLARGQIADFGNGMNPNVERILEVHPEVLLLTPFEHSGGYGRAERLGIPIVECAEYMEATPLGRAEWMLFYGELFGADSAAFATFERVETTYLALCDSAARATTRPLLLTETLYGGQWFVPSGASTMAHLFADAGAKYAFAHLPGRGSTALSFEAVLAEAGEADVWLIKQGTATPLSYDRLAADYQPYTRFRPYRERHIYVCDLARTHFYEETPFHPELLLADIIAVLHPNLLHSYTPRYYKPL